jgi:glycosyltransferase involved in cell wall biosynthesis
MNYFICQSWKSTKGNHAGMVHLCSLIKKIDSANIRCYYIPQIKLGRIGGIFAIQIYWLIYFFMAIFLCFKTKKEDKVFLMEYLLPMCNQHIIAQMLNLKRNNITIVGLAHLVPGILNKMFTDVQLNKWCNDINVIATLGSSLSKYLEHNGVSKEKIYTTFHYVDHEYYRLEKRRNLNTDKTLKVIIMGAIQRDFHTIVQIIQSVHNVHFYLLKGRVRLENTFIDTNNVTVFDYLEEQQVKELLAESDVSLNVMYDTIGSNVITTSMAMELAMLVSDVGSIRDYCNDTNAIFCNSANDFISALKKLDSERELLFEMQKHSFLLSKKLDTEIFYKNLKKSCTIN